MKYGQKNGLIRNIRLVLHNFSIFLIQFPLVLIAVFIYSQILGAKFDMLRHMITMLVILLPATSSMQNYTLHYKYTIGFGSTKKNYFIACLLNIFLYGVFAMTVTLIWGLIDNDSMLGNSAAEIIFVLFAAIAAGMLGLFWGILMYKSYKLGIIVYMISFMGIIGVSIAYAVNNGIRLTGGSIQENFNLTSPVSFIAVILFGVAMSIANLLLSKKLEIK